MSSSGSSEWLARNQPPSAMLATPMPALMRCFPGSVSAAEVNRTAAWLATFTREHHLPQKLFVVHQFKTSMIRDIGTIRRHPELALVQHVDGFGTPSQKLATYHTVARPRLFTMGFKLFYDEDVHRMSARAVHAIRPAVRFVSFQ